VGSQNAFKASWQKIDVYKETEGRLWLEVRLFHLRSALFLERIAIVGEIK